jgi:hypothetical protein
MPAVPVYEEVHPAGCGCPMGQWFAHHQHPAVIVVVARAAGRLRAGPMHLACAAKLGADVARLVEDAPANWRCLHCQRPIAPNLEN